MTGGRRMAVAAVAASAVAAAALIARPAGAGAYIFAGEGTENRVTHPSGYTGGSGTLDVKVCIDPTSANASSMALPVANAVRTWNALSDSTGNLKLGSSNNVPFSAIDWESVVVHEIGHCVGLAHVNLASESGLSGSDRDYTKSTDGANDIYDLARGADAVRGSGDDLRFDDGNLHWFRKSTNDPFGIADTVDASAYSRLLADLPSGHTYATNGDRTVSTAVYGLPQTESVMQQGTGIDEAQRTLIGDDAATIRLAESGLDMLAGTADDYRLRLVYGGISADPSCQLNVTFDDAKVSLAACFVSGTTVASSHLRITAADIYFNSGFNWFFNDIDNSATLTVNRAGAGAGTVTSARPGISCNTDCSETWSAGAVVRLDAVAAPGSVFTGWSGACAGTSATASVTLTGDLTCTATFAVTPATHSLAVIRSGGGSGTVTSSPVGIACGTDCSEAYSQGTVVTLTAAAALGSAFSGWSGDCAGTAAQATVTLDQDRACTAQFDAASFTLDVLRSGPGAGDVSSSPIGISCGADCSETYVAGTTVSLAATPQPGSRFVQWSVDCSGTVATTSVAMTADRSCTAEFGSGCGDGNEPNDSLATATPVATGDFVTSPAGTCIDGGGDVDLFSLACPAGDLLVATALVELQGSSLDPSLALLDGAGNVLVTNDSVGTGVRDARLGRTMAAGTRYLRVTALAGTSGPYTLRAYCMPVGSTTNFGDVPPSHMFYRWLVPFSAAGITSGCQLAPPLYCPDALVTRGQMAVFLVRALGAAADAGGPPIYADVPAGHMFYGHIQAITGLGIMQACATSPTRFCPDVPVSRAQMAVFVIRALGNAPRPDLGPSFVDVPTSHPSYPSIEPFSVQGITSGCALAPPRYCPDAPVTRGQMGVFLVRAFGLPVAPGLGFGPAGDVAEGAGVDGWILDHDIVEVAVPAVATGPRSPSLGRRSTTSD